MPRKTRRRQTIAPHYQPALPFSEDSPAAPAGVRIPLVSSQEAAEPITLESRRHRRRR